MAILYTQTHSNIKLLKNSTHGSFLGGYRGGDESYDNIVQKVRANPKASWNWHKVSTAKLTEDFIREYQDSVDWTLISTHQKLSEPFIREFKDKLGWWCISRFQTLSEDFMKEFCNEIFWGNISEENLQDLLLLWCLQIAKN